MSRSFYLIEKEHEKSKDYMLETFPDKKGKRLVSLTLDNVARVEAMIRNDSKYLKASQKNNKKASPYWILEMNKYLTEANYEGKETFEKTVEKVVEYIDRENTTHLNVDGGRKYMKDRIIQKRDNLISLLRNPEETNFEIIDYLVGDSTPNADLNERQYCHLSFVSKFCHYSCFYMFEKTPEQDNFSIYDSVVKKALPDYCLYYGIEKKSQKKLSNYNEYRKTIDQIIKRSKARISRNGFDHLIWYYFKGRQ